ncbi:unannotated protein [freshwater metagenome]|uniref:Unannotated protein n=1 Tax=freshwater metagenome TaxID=449393 RepID=A0A6J6H5T2_9ZZZZ
MLTARMNEHSVQQRFEEAAFVRDRIDAIHTAIQRHLQAESLRSHTDLHIEAHGVRYLIENGVLVGTQIDGENIDSSTVAIPELKFDMREIIKMPIDESPTETLDEVMCLARLVESLQPTEQ